MTETSTKRRRGWRLVALLAVLSLIVAACGGDSGEEAEATTTTAAAGETTTTEAASEETTTTEATTDGEGPSGTLTIGWNWDPGTMDPQMHRQRYTQIISHAMRDKLYYQEPPGLGLIPLLAESVTQVDDTNYDVKIKEGILFHNGDELTAEDVVYTFERLWDPATESPRASMGNMSEIAGVEQIDTYTVRWTTSIPFGPPDQAILGFHFSGQEILHKATYESLSLEEAASQPVVGVGPFKFVEWIPDQRVVMEANLDYWQGAPGVEQIVWRTIPEEATRVAELLAGSVDMIHPVSPDFVAQLEDAGMKLEIVPGTAMRMLMMNVRDGSPFADVEVRRAMNMGINKAAIVDSIYSGLAIAQGNVSGSGQEGHNEDYNPYPYDPDAAAAILSQVTEPIELFVQEQWQLAAEAIAEELRGYGMDVTAVVLDNATHTQINEEGTFDLMFGGAGYGSGDFSGAYYNNRFECARLETNRVRTGICDEALDTLMNEGVRGEADPATRAANLEEVIRLLTEEHVPWVPMFVEAEVWAMAPHVEGFRGSAAGQMFDLWKVTVGN
ncbi:MAG: ABC transporter substrate-binding protein [Acidimicrobiia bacterium]